MAALVIPVFGAWGAARRRQGRGIAGANVRKLSKCRAVSGEGSAGRPGLGERPRQRQRQTQRHQFDHRPMGEQRHRERVGVGAAIARRKFKQQAMSNLACNGRRPIPKRDGVRASQPSGTAGTHDGQHPRPMGATGSPVTPPCNRSTPLRRFGPQQSFAKYRQPIVTKIPRKTAAAFVAAMPPGTQNASRFQPARQRPRQQ